MKSFEASSSTSSGQPAYERKGACRRPETASMPKLTARAPETSGESGCVWVVDDSRLEADRICQLLSEGYDVESFSEGAVMLERLSEQSTPDLILLDWQMPGVSGLDVCRFLRERYDEVSLPILMLTSRGAKEDFREGLCAGANDYVAKPYDDAELLARVRNLVRTGQQAEAMREREQWFSATLRSIADAVVTTDVDGRVTFLNRAAQELIGCSHDEALGRPFADVFRVMDETIRERVEDPVETMLRGGGQGRIANGAVLLRHDGTEVPIDHSAAPIGEGPGLGAVVVFRDVTERKKAESEAKNRADFEDKLIGIVSHDLRNPLHAILLGALNLLALPTLDEISVKTALRIQSSAERAARLVGDLLDFTQARFGTGIPVHRTTLDLRDVASLVLEEMHAAHPERRVRLEVSGDVRGEWDPDRIAQVLSNLVSNAIKYGAQTDDVVVRIRDEGEWANMEVHNKGAPIPQETLPVLFQPMKRGNLDRSDRSVGLGLYIVKHIVDAHAGTIEVRSSASTGTSFVVRLRR